MNRNARLLGWLLVAVVAVLVGRNWLPEDPAAGPPALTAPAQTLPATGNAAAIETAALAQLPAGERPAITATLALIEAGGPFPYRQDGSEFENRERRLPIKGPGYYREYTVETPASPDRGARRIVAGGNGEIYYTRDHYRSFVRLD